jgi:Ubiquitin carboxyl-terminal hydrolase
MYSSTAHNVHMLALYVYRDVMNLLLYTHTPTAGRGEGPYKVHPASYYLYELTGILVHTGTAEQGHYFSYARVSKGTTTATSPTATSSTTASCTTTTTADTDSDATTAAATAVSDDSLSTEVWVEFNDTNVRPWDPARMAEDCFGGPRSYGHSSRAADDLWSSTVMTPAALRDNPQNAYLLVYERSQQQQQQQQLMTVPCDSSSSSSGSSGDSSELLQLLPAPLAAEVAAENSALLFAQHLYGPDLAQCVLALLKEALSNINSSNSSSSSSSAAVATARQLSLWACDYATGCLARAPETRHFSAVVQAVADLVCSAPLLATDTSSSTASSSSTAAVFTAAAEILEAQLAPGRRSSSSSSEAPAVAGAAAAVIAAGTAAAAAQSTVLCELLLECTDRDVREAVRAFYCMLVCALADSERPLYISSSSTARLPRMVDALLALLPVAARHWHKMEQVRCCCNTIHIYLTQF